MNDISEELRAKMTGWRRHLHANPELATKEVETAAFVAAILRQGGISVERGIGGHGLVGRISRPGSSRSVGLRADMDALPILETTGLDYASKLSGVMHACGHDGHTASLLGAAQLLVEDPDWSGTVYLIFQPAEEGGIGAAAMIRDGILNRFPMNAIYAYHNWPGLPAGSISAQAGPIMATGARIEIEVSGVSAHAGMPHRCRDAVLASGHILTALQSIVSRVVDPVEMAVVSITTLQAGAAYNQIADHVAMTGTLRALKPEVSQRVEAEIIRICENIANAFGVKAKILVLHSSPATVNDERKSAIASRAAEGVGVPLCRNVPPSMAGEDFAFFLQQIPGAMVWIGNGEFADGCELHSPGYNFNDAILPTAARWFQAVAKAELVENL